ncbi:MAG: ACT domain-containing protein [Maribacter sp.]
MSGETNLTELIRNMTPTLQHGSYVFTTVADVNDIDRHDTICEFKEVEGVTLVLEQSKADALHLEYDFVAAWITLEVHSALNAVGLTAAISEVLAQNHISCNVIAGFYHDHLFVEHSDAERAVDLLKQLSKTG